MLLGFACTRLFELPLWITPAICFNNTTSLPLLLIQSLESSGVLEALLRSDSDTTSAAVKRAKSYILVCAVVGTSLTFALGPRLLDGEESPDDSKDKWKEDGNNDGESHGNGDVDHAHQPRGSLEQPREGNDRSVNEETSLLSNWVVREGGELGREGYDEGRKYWIRLPL